MAPLAHALCSLGAAAAAALAEAAGRWRRVAPGEPRAAMEARKMNLPRGPENLCFDKDEFMKVSAGCRGS